MRKSCIKWGLYFDRIYCIRHLTEGKENTRIIDELDRVGILDSGIFEWRNTTFSPCDKLIAEKSGGFNPAYVNLGLERLKIMNEALYFGYKDILLLEEDVSFLKDLVEIEEILKHRPLDAEIVQYDKQILDDNNGEYYERMSINKGVYYIERPLGTFWTSLACIGFHQTGIKKFRDTIISKKGGCLTTGDEYLRYCDAKKYVVVKNIAIQDVEKNNAVCLSCRKSVVPFINSYVHYGIDIRDFSVSNIDVISTYNKCIEDDIFSYKGDGWTIDDNSFQILDKLIKEVQPKHALDIGIGKTSLLMEKYGVETIHVDQDDGYIKEFLFKHAYIKKEDYKFLPTKKSCNGEFVYEGFREQFKNKKFDFVIIDGPYDTSNATEIRTDVCNNLGILDENYCIAIHDVNRDRDMKSAKKLAHKLNQKLYVFNKGERWLGVISNHIDVENIIKM